MSLITAPLVVSLGQHSHSVCASCSVNTGKTRLSPSVPSDSGFFQMECKHKIRVSANNPSQSQPLLSLLPWCSQVKPWEEAEEAMREQVLGRVSLQESSPAFERVQHYLFNRLLSCFMECLELNSMSCCRKLIFSNSLAPGLSQAAAVDDSHSVPAPELCSVIVHS